MCTARENTRNHERTIQKRGRKMMKQTLSKILIALGILFSVATPVLASDQEVTIKIPVESDYDDVILEGEGLNLEIKNEIELSYTQLGNYKYEIYRKDDAENKYHLQVMVMNNDSGEMVAEAVLSKNDDAQKYTKIEFKKDKKNPSEPQNNVPSKKNEIGTGIHSSMHAYLFGSMIVFILGILMLKKTSKENSL
jgi:hypothetical protein